MNRKQREKNRRTARELRYLVRKKQQAEHTCQRCGQKGSFHWQVIPTSLEAIMMGDPGGVWLCDKRTDEGAGNTRFTLRG